MIRHPRSEAGAHAEAARGRITPDTFAGRDTDLTIER